MSPVGRQLQKKETLTPEAEHRLKSELLIQENLRLVLKIANDFLGRGLPWEDLVSEGNRGLVTAAKRYDPAKGAKFSTYSAWWIKQAIRQAIAEQVQTVRIPIGTLQYRQRIRRVERELICELHRAPTDEELAEKCRLALATIRHLRHAPRWDMQSLNAAVGKEDEDGAEFLDFIADERTPAPDELQIRLEDIDELLKLLSELPERERRILQLRFGLDGEAVRTLEEVGLAIGCTNERVRQLQNIALKKLQTRMRKAK